MGDGEADNHRSTTQNCQCLKTHSGSEAIGRTHMRHLQVGKRALIGAESHPTCGILCTNRAPRRSVLTHAVTGFADGRFKPRGRHQCCQPLPMLARTERQAIIRVARLLKIEPYPCRRVVASVYLSTRPSVYIAVHKTVRDFRREKKVIESHAFVLWPPFVFIVPERPEWPVRMQSPQSVGPALR